MESSNNAASEVRAVEASLVNWHRALENHDWVAVAAGLTSSFLMIEHERIMDKESLLKLVMDSSSRGRQRAALHNFRTEVCMGCAWTTVQNDEIWVANDGDETPFSFLETAVFRFEFGGWQIDRYHATRLVPKGE